jgi:arsenate reductase-like glutaredoxin family protein
MKRLYIHPGCSKCRQAQDALRGAREIEIVNYTKTPFSKEKLLEIAAQVGIHHLLRENSPVYKENRDRFATMTAEQIAEWMVEEPSLIRRPIFERDGYFLIGLSEENIRSMLD